MKTLRLHLAPDEHWRLPDVACWRIRCNGGMLWISCRGDSRDYLLHEGHSVELVQKRGVVVGAIDAATLSLEAPSPARLSQRLMALMAANLFGGQA